MIGIIGAMDEEIELIKGTIDIVDEKYKAGMHFFICKYGKTEFVLVRSGIGKVNAAICTQLLIDMFNVDMVINTGVAGAVEKGLNVGDIVVSCDLVEHDMDASVFGDPVGQVPRMDVFSFKADDKLIHIAEKSGMKVVKDKHVKVGRIVSGDQFISSEHMICSLRQQFNASAVEMEGAAIGHTCHVNNIPFVVIRCISDNADKNANMDFSNFVHVAARQSANMVLDMISSIK